MSPFSRIRTGYECGKIRTRITPNTDTFEAVRLLLTCWLIVSRTFNTMGNYLLKINKDNRKVSIAVSLLLTLKKCLFIEIGRNMFKVSHIDNKISETVHDKRVTLNCPISLSLLLILKNVFKFWLELLVSWNSSMTTWHYLQVNLSVPSWETQLFTCSKSTIKTI